MAPTSRRADSALEKALFDRAYDFDFFQAVRLLAALLPGRGRVGGTAPPGEEVVRFGAWASVAFPASAVYDISQVVNPGEPPRMTVTFFGLTGTQGILPLHYTERIIARNAAKDNVLAAFLDMFNHRLLSLFYRAWEKYRQVVLWEAAAAEKNGPDPVTHGLFDVIGMGTGGLRSRMRIPDAPLLFYAGLIAQRPHSASALRGILRDYFAVPVEIDQCLGSWYPLEERDRCYLNAEEERCQVGIGAFLGDEVWDQQARFRIRVGPVGLDRFKSFLPEGTGMAELIELTRFMVGLAAPFEVQLILEAGEVPYCRLTDEGDEAPRLGWMAWLKTGDFTAHAADAVFAYVN